MQIELDHILVCTDPGAPEAEEFIRFGLREGEPNTHPGQGTANRRFPFANSMIELAWVSDAAEAQSPLARRTLLWERWSNRSSGASPFGICLRPTDETAARGANADMPFPGWAYKPSYLPEPLAFHIGDATTAEPMWVYLSFMLGSQRATHFTENRAGLREITGLTLHTPTLLESEASRAVVSNGILSARVAERPLLEIEFDSRRRGRHKDFRPLLPLIFHF
jgi:Glyoxalase-like domain